MELELQKTEDGSHTLYLKEKNEHYHSVHGSINEAMVVYIQATLAPLLDMAEKYGLKVIRIFEMGFGTGLNTFLSMLFAEDWVLRKNYEVQVEYTSVERYPLSKEIWTCLNYPYYAEKMFSNLDINFDSCFKSIHEQPFDGLSSQDFLDDRETSVRRISSHFFLRKLKGDILAMDLPCSYFHGIYYDAFAPTIQPELWSFVVFEKLFRSQVATGTMRSDVGGVSVCVDSLSGYSSILSTYCAKGQVKRDLKKAGYTLESLPGPVGKREITRAFVQ